MAKKSKKSTDFEVRKRVDRVFDMLSMGVSRADIHRYGYAEWEVSEYQIDVYIKRARELFIEISDTEREDEMGRALYRLNHLFQKNMTIQDFKAALATQKELNVLLGLYAPKEVNLNINYKQLEQLAQLANDLDKPLSEVFEAMIQSLSRKKAELDASNRLDRGNG